jgi:hypothetical protein
VSAGASVLGRLGEGEHLGVAEDVGHQQHQEHQHGGGDDGAEGVATGGQRVEALGQGPHFVVAHRVDPGRGLGRRHAEALHLGRHVLTRQERPHPGARIVGRRRGGLHGRCADHGGLDRTDEAEMRGAEDQDGGDGLAQVLPHGSDSLV